MKCIDKKQNNNSHRFVHCDIFGTSYVKSQLRLDHPNGSVKKRVKDN